MDYYSILGVPRTASQEEIKRAFRKLAMQHHPDKGGNEEMFKQINEAYDTLGNPQKRSQYDNPQPQFRFNHTDFYNGMNPFADMFGFGGGRPRRNRDVTINIKLTLEDVIKGKQLSARYQLPSGKLRDTEIDIPPGVDNGIGIRFEGLGDDSIPGIPNGDLIVRVRIMNHPVWKREGNDLHLKLTVSIFQCMLGSSAEITTLEGKTLEMKIPRGTQPSATFSIANHGVPDINTGIRGNIFVKLNTIVPKIDDPSILKDIERIRDALN